ncbi:MAG: hypothetical protein ACLTBV_11200 [Enterocloster bolteae]
MNATAMMSVLLVVMVVLYAGITTALSRAVRRPISQIAEAAENLRQGT